MTMTKRAQGGAMPEAASAQKILFELQVEQHLHDETYHREIARLSLHQRLNHMALHFAKYAGKVAAATTIEGAVPVYVDTLIIALATADALNVELWSLLEHEVQDYPGLLAYGRALATKLHVADDLDELIRYTAIAAGRVAAACEKIDHLEEINFREEIRAGVARLAAISLSVLATHGLEPTQAVRSRLAGVKERLLLHGRI